MSTPPRRTRLVIALLAAGLAVAVSACGSDADQETATTATTVAETTTTADAGVVSDEGGLTIAAPWARTSPMDAAFGAVYLELTSADGDALVGAAVAPEVAASVEIHETVAADAATDGTDGTDGTATTMGADAMGSDESSDTTAGMGAMTMQPIDSLDLPAGQTVTLEPGGYHIMLIDLAAPLETGQEIEVTLTFENAGERTITVPVQDDAP